LLPQRHTAAISIASRRSLRINRAHGDVHRQDSSRRTTRRSSRRATDAFRLMLNSRAADALGVSVPQAPQLRADEVIR
jgi:hypothetical protein